MALNSNILNLDLANDPNIERYEAGAAELFLLNAADIINVINERNGSSLVLDKSEYTGVLASSTLRVTQRANDQDDYRWIYDGCIKLREKMEEAAYFDALENAVSEVDDLSLNGFYFNNNRLLVSKASGSLAVVALFDGEEISYQNEVSLVGIEKPEVKLSLAAPTIDQAEANGAGAQLISHLQGYLLALNAVAIVADGQPRHRQLIITPTGPFYPTKKPGLYARRSRAETTATNQPIADGGVNRLINLDDYR